MQALIIGGGIAGPAAGIALRKAGHEATVFEAYPTLTAEVGYFLTGRQWARRTVGPRGRRRGARGGLPTPQMVFRNGAGKVLGRLGNGGAAADGTPSQTIKRADLYRALHAEAERAGVQFAYGPTGRHRDPGDGAEVIARFTDGSMPGATCWSAPTACIQSPGPGSTPRRHGRATCPS